MSADPGQWIVLRDTKQYWLKEPTPLYRVAHP
jgi:hypothetical protein